MPTLRPRHVGPALIVAVLLAVGCGSDTPGEPAELAAGIFAAHASGWVLPASGGARQTFEQTLDGRACFDGEWLSLDTPGLTVRGVVTLPVLTAVPVTLTLPGASGADPQAWVNVASLGTGSITATAGTVTVTALTESELTGSFHWTGSPSATPAEGVVTFTGSVRAVRRADCSAGT